MTQGPNRPFDRSFKEFFFEAAEDGRLAARPARDRRPPIDAPLFPEPQGDFMDYEDDLSPEEAEMIEQERLKDIARVTLPEHGEITDALHFISGLDALSLMTAATVEDEFRDRLDHAAVDRMTAAALIIGAENAAEIASFFPVETEELVMEFLNAAEAADGKKRQNRIARFSSEAKHLYLASIAADLEVTLRGLKDGTAVPPRKPQMEAMASLVTQTAALDGMDAGLLQRAVSYYNALAEDLGLSQRLIQKQDGTVYASKGGHQPPRPGKGPRKP